MLRFGGQRAVAPSASEYSLLFFAHIPKAGGTTLRRLCYAKFGEENCLKVWDPRFGGDILPREFWAAGPDHINRARAIVGHLALDSFLENEEVRKAYDPEEILVVASIRDPVDRLISLYNYIKYNKNHPLHDQVSTMGALEYIRQESANPQARYLCTGNEKNRPLSCTMLVFPMEYSVQALVNILGLDVDPARFPVLNSARERAGGAELFGRENMPGPVLSELYRKHSLDWRLYRRAREKQNWNLSECGLKLDRAPGD